MTDELRARLSKLLTDAGLEPVEPTSYPVSGVGPTLLVLLAVAEALLKRVEALERQIPKGD